MASPIAPDDGAPHTALFPDSEGPFVERRKADRRRSGRRNESAVTADDRLPFGSEQCTDRERQIMALLLRGLTNKEIARHLGVVEDTVKKHLLHVYTKLGVRRRSLIMLGIGGRAKRRSAHS